MHNTLEYLCRVFASIDALIRQGITPGRPSFGHCPMRWPSPVRVQRTRDATFLQKDQGGTTVNWTEAIAQLGGSASGNEEADLSRT